MKASEQDMSYLLEICRREDGFTLAQIVARVIHERPAKIPEVARAWEELNRRGMLKIRKRGRPSIYELVRRSV